MDDRARLRLGYLAVALAAVLWAIGGNVASELIGRGASPVELTAGRSGIALAGVGSIVFLRRGRNAGKQGGEWLRKNLGPLLVFGLSLAAANFTYYAAIALLPVAVALVIQYTAPGLVVAFKALVGRQRPSRRVLGSLVLVLAGVVLLSEVYRAVAGANLSFAALAIAFASAVAFAAYILLGEFVGPNLGAERSVFYGFAVASAFWALVLGWRGRISTLLDPDFWPGLAFLGVAATIMPFLLFLWGLGVVRASPAGIISTLEPVSGAVIAYLWLGQSLSPAQVLGAAAVIAGIAVVQSELPVSQETLVERAVAE